LVKPVATRTVFWALLAALWVSVSPAKAETFKVDPEHTAVLFNVRHLFTSVSGRFERFQGQIDFDEQHPDKTHVEGTIDAASVNNGRHLLPWWLVTLLQPAVAGLPA
jgi:polyisoprenoid-binding protein YceI